jgi:dolichol-phosphate mannosyltransferase
VTPSSSAGSDDADGSRSIAALGRVLVIVPTYNEKENLEIITERLRTAVPGVDLLVVDDASPDGTGEIADTLAAADEHIQVLHRAGKGGLGAAYVAGFGWGLERGYDVLVEMDADGSHQPEQLPRLLNGLLDADLVLGARYVRGGSVVNWPAKRKWLSVGGNTYVRLALGVPLRDITGGYRAYRRQALEGIRYEQVESQGYCFQVELAWRVWRDGFRVVEVPITFVERVRGESKMVGSIVTEALWRVTVWGVTSLRARGKRAPHPRSVLTGR